MISGLASYINDLKTKLDENIYSPIFIRLANLYYHDNRFEECINVCTIGLEIYPDYITARIILLKALLKVGYLAEAENNLKLIESKFPNNETVKNFRSELKALRKSDIQEKIYYSNKINTPLDFHNYSKRINSIIESQDADETDLDTILLYMQENETSSLIDKRSFEKFVGDYNDIKLNSSKQIRSNPDTEPQDNRKPNIPAISQNSFLLKIKIITETLADLLAKQGYFKEAFEAYNMLLQTDSANKRRIQEKLYELERNFS